ncbi:MAG: hypothetical protein IT318_23695 [Anaerolineales bacterium]|nr:hypothetical protein [Anaerolineales bacterium]
MSILSAPVSTNGSGRPGEHPAGRWEEIGTTGLAAMGGFIQAAYTTELTWPSCYPVYNRLRRADPEVTIVRQILSAMASRVRLEFRRPQTDIAETDDDRRALAFANSTLADLDGGAENFLDTLVAQVPFMGWGYWEAVPGLRRQNWRPPGDDAWRSEFDDGLVAYRRLAWRDHSSFMQWDLDDYTGRLRGLVQNDPPNPQRTIPVGRAVHITFGDADNPEGLTPLEALWRLERIKYGLEVVHGIGYEHAAGYLSVTSEKEQLTEIDHANIKRAARYILTAQEGNYAAWPKGLTGELIDVPFAAAPAILEAIRYYGLLKLTLYNMQWVGMSVISGTGSFAALKDSSAMWLVAFNAMLAGFARQIDQQYGKRLFAMNPDAFPGMTLRPQLHVTEVDKDIDLQELGAFWNNIKDSMPIGDDDYLAVRHKTGFLPEALPVVAEGSGDAADNDEAPADDDGDDAEMGWRGKLFDAALEKFNKTIGNTGAA